MKTLHGSVDVTTIAIPPQRTAGKSGMNQIAVCLHIDIPERTVHLKAFDLDRLITCSG